ncbi:hypothetical protein [Pelagicoccus sp. SDUM812002]|uniref:hypothetical protein n=1 Tax=Pelagicoccus sp. SDUM812002 TaxID=3041266 RepID=UPI00280EE90A|nr:hypothetical protein [Pelagicoccus sp. SDUM812002]MDQ8187032.1 hypothetical protein [Pelagicoccus sp. SDUM812002]
MGARLFVDGSCDPHSGIGYGAALYLPAGCEEAVADEMRSEIVVRRFASCRSSSLELKAFLWALERWGGSTPELEVHSDSQTITDLPSRRAALEESSFCSKSGKPLSQAGLYREFYDAFDRFAPSLIKRDGHKRAGEKSQDDLLFALVDRGARRALREALR